ncbi:hypothetical protein CsatA_000128 [Cannabis sativa]
MAALGVNLSSSLAEMRVKIESLSATMNELEIIKDLMEAIYSENPNCNHGDNNNITNLQGQLGREFTELYGHPISSTNYATIFRAISFVAANHDVLRVFLAMPKDWKKKCISDIGHVNGKII